ncbi:hypothetical protein ACFPRL_21460 [Pseudoclavibacter helvolus]
MRKPHVCGGTAPAPQEEQASGRGADAPRPRLRRGRRLGRGAPRTLRAR